MSAEIPEAEWVQVSLRVIEFKAFRYPLAAQADLGLPEGLGVVKYDTAGVVLLLHFAPGRFLAPEPTLAIERHLQALVAAGVGSVFDVTGKWQILSLFGADAERILSAGFDLEQVLSNRNCASVHLFDCPTIVVRRGGGFDLYVQASYLTHLREVVDSVRNRSAATG